MKRTSKIELIGALISNIIAVIIEVAYYIVIRMKLYELTIYNQTLNREFIIRIYTFLPGVLSLGFYLYMRHHIIRDKEVSKIFKTIYIVSFVCSLFISIFVNTLYFYSLTSGNPMMPVQH